MYCYGRFAGSRDLGGVGKGRGGVVVSEAADHTVLAFSDAGDAIGAAMASDTRIALCLADGRDSVQGAERASADLERTSLTTKRYRVIATTAVLEAAGRADASVIELGWSFTPGSGVRTHLVALEPAATRPFDEQPVILLAVAPRYHARIEMVGSAPPDLLSERAHFDGLVAAGCSRGLLRAYSDASIYVFDDVPAALLALRMIEDDVGREPLGLACAYALDKGPVPMAGGRALGDGVFRVGRLLNSTRADTCTMTQEFWARWSAGDPGPTSRLSFADQPPLMVKGHSQPLDVGSVPVRQLLDSIEAIASPGEVRQGNESCRE